MGIELYIVIHLYKPTTNARQIEKADLNVSVYRFAVCIMFEYAKLDVMTVYFHVEHVQDRKGIT